MSDKVDVIFYSIIIVLLIILIVYYWNRDINYHVKHDKYNDELIVEERPILNQVREKVVYKHGPTCTCDKCVTIETDFTNTQMEFFNSDACKLNSDENLTDKEFNNTNGGYEDFLKEKAIGPDVRKNQAEFIKEIANPQNGFMGPTYTPDVQIENGPTNWLGILGPPQRVQVKNATQEPENVETYPTSRAIRFGDGNSW